MKTTDFLKLTEDLGEDAARMHQDHEVQMARQDCYSAAKNAIALHHLLKQIDELEGLDGWVSEKITLAADYLKSVRDSLEYELMSGNAGQLPSFEMESAARALDNALSESATQVDEIKAKEIVPNGNGKTDDPREKLRKIKDKIKQYEELIKQHSDGMTARVADYIAKRDRLVKQKEKLVKMGMKEDASAGGVSAGAVATAAVPLMKKVIKRKAK